MATFSMFFNGGNGVAFNFVMNDMTGRASERATQVAARMVCVWRVVDAVADAAATAATAATIARWVLWVVDWWVGGV